MLFRHRSTAESMAAALAPGFADATSSTYNNITDYVLGPMHGHPYPVAAESRPLPSDAHTFSDGCWPDDSDSEEEDPGTSQLLPVTEADSTMQTAASDSSTVGSFKMKMDLIPPQVAASHNPSAVTVELQPVQQQPLNDTPQARHNQDMTTSSSSLCDRPSSQKGGASAPSDRQRSHQHETAGPQRSSAISTAQRRTFDTLAELKRQFGQDDSSRSSFSFTLPLSWITPKRARSDDSAHESHGSGIRKH